MSTLLRTAELVGIAVAVLGALAAGAGFVMIAVEAATRRAREAQFRRDVPPPFAPSRERRL